MFIVFDFACSVLLSNDSVLFTCMLSVQSATGLNQCVEILRTEFISEWPNVEHAI